MKNFHKRILGGITSLLPSMLLISAVQTEISAPETEAIAVETYLYGYPLVTMDLTRQVTTNVEFPGQGKAPMGQFVNMRTYPNASYRDVTAPNADTLYSAAWLDLANEPYVLHVPNEEGRYYLMPMLSGWTEVFSDIGTRTTGTDAAKYAITGPNWAGTLPEGVKEIKSPTNMVWILGRTYSTGTPEDYKLVHELQDQYTLTPLSAFGQSYTPPKGTVDPNLDMKTPVRDQVNRLDAEIFFTRLAKLMKSNPPAPADAPLIRKMAKIGIVPGKEFDFSKLSPEQKQAFEDARKVALEKIASLEKNGGRKINGWEFTTQTGNYGTDYLQRAFITAIGLGANKPQDAIYPLATTDKQGQPLDGANHYLIHFDKNQLPPVQGFWSLTMYDDQYFFVNNPINRYSISPRNKLAYNPDGSLDLYIQNAPPGTDKENNWLPAPPGKFVLMLRLYWPKESVLNGTWQPPSIDKAK